jgi:uncharacterized cupin superfamily protein
MPKIDPATVPVGKGSTYPTPFDSFARERTKQALGNAGGLTEFGVNLTVLPHGQWSSQRHWHTLSDEFVFVLEGELALITNDGETVVKAGQCAAFPKGVANGHHFVNKSVHKAVYLEVGTRHSEDQAEYPDIDMYATNHGYFHKDGRPY